MESKKRSKSDDEGAGRECDNISSRLENIGLNVAGSNRYGTYPRRRKKAPVVDDTAYDSDHEYLGGIGYTEQSRSARAARQTKLASSSEGATTDSTDRNDNPNDWTTLQKLGLHIRSGSASATDDESVSQPKGRDRIQKVGLNVFHLLLLPHKLGYDTLPIRAVQMTRNILDKEKGIHLTFDEVWTAMVGQLTLGFEPPVLPLNTIRKEYWKQLQQFVDDRFSQIHYNVKEKTWQMKKITQATTYKTLTYQYYYHMDDEEVQKYSEFSDYTSELVQRIISGLVTGDTPCLGNGDGREALAAMFMLAREILCNRTFNRTVLDHCIVKNRGGGAIETTLGSANLVLYTYMADGSSKQARAFLNEKSKMADGYIKGCVPDVQLCKLVDEECWPLITGEVKSTSENPTHDVKAVREGIKKPTENEKRVSLQCWVQALVGLENDRQEKSYGVLLYSTELRLYQLHYHDDQGSRKISTTYRRYPLTDQVVDATKVTKYMKFNSQKFLAFLHDIAAIVFEEFPAK